MRKASSGLLRNNCFLKDAYSFVDLKTQYPKKQFESYDVVHEVGDDGMPVLKHKLTLHDYEITPESVDSQVQAADYRNDVLGAIAKATPGKNLGDVSSMQDIMSMDDADALQLMSQLQARFAVKEQSVEQAETKTEVKTDVE